MLSFFQYALDAVNGKRCVQEFLNQKVFNKDLYTIAIGKASIDMMQGAIEVTHKGLVITRYGYSHNSFANDVNIQVIESGHPLPDHNSLTAGDVLIEFIQQIPSGSECLFLLSGGASALAERLPEGLELADLENINHWLIGSGLDIQQINLIRKQLSCIKGGRLASYFTEVKVTQLILSDVIGDHFDVIGSGMLVANEQKEEIAQIPEWAQDLINQAPPMPEPGDISFNAIESCILANNSTALQSIKERAVSEGLPVFIETEPLVNEVQKVAEFLGQYIKTAKSGLHVFGGEPVVCLPDQPGRGGRMQMLALLLAKEISGRDDVFILCGATDGSDGSGEDAGALVDGKTIERADIEGFVFDDCVCKADAGTCLEATGDLIQTGPTGSNVNDVVIILKN